MTCLNTDAPDFAFMELDSHSCIIGPMSYQRTLFLLRAFMYENAPESWTDLVDVSIFTLQEYTLELCCQLSAPDHSRAVQGHHAHGSVVWNQSKLPYSRKSVHAVCAGCGTILSLAQHISPPIQFQSRCAYPPLRTRTCWLHLPEPPFLFAPLELCSASVGGAELVAFYCACFMKSSSHLTPCFCLWMTSCSPKMQTSCRFLRS